MQDRKKTEMIIVTVLAIAFVSIILGNLSSRKPLTQLGANDQSILIPSQKPISTEVINISENERRALRWGIDPFRVSGLQLETRPQAAELSKFRLTGILWSENRSAAIINDQIVHQGDSLNGCTILEIGKESVSIQCEGQMAELRQGGIGK